MLGLWQAALEKDSNIIQPFIGLESHVNHAMEIPIFREKNFI